MNNYLQKLIQHGAIVIFDMDGTITEARFSPNDETRILNCNNDDGSLILRNYRSNIYENIAVIPQTKAVINDLIMENRKFYVLSQVHDGIEVVQKIELLDKVFPNFNAKDYFIGTINSEQKQKILKEMAENNAGIDIVYVDDSLSFLIESEAKMSEEGIENVHFFHISSVLV